jgi:hypothetical protein
MGESIAILSTSVLRGVKARTIHPVSGEMWTSVSKLLRESLLVADYLADSKTGLDQTPLWGYVRKPWMKRNCKGYESNQPFNHYNRF